LFEKPGEFIQTINSIIKMKTSNCKLNVCSLLIMMLCTFNVSWSRDSKNEKDSATAAKIEMLVEQQHYVFNAQSATPMKGGYKHLSAGYDLKVTKDTITSDLPYYGRAYQGGYGTSDGGIKFTSLEFDYKIEKGKKEGWVITIKTKDIASAREMVLTAFENGSASLNVNANDRQPISYTGYITGMKN
jgi:hypothetical protein